MTDYTNFTVSLFGGMQGNTAVAGNAATIVQEYAADTALKGGVDLLYVQIHNASGGLISKTNLWSTLGAMPLYASGSVVVSYALYGKDAATPDPKDAAAVALNAVVKKIGGSDKDGNYYPMLAAGLFGVATPYHTIGQVPKAVLLDKQGYCDASNHATLPNATAGAEPEGADSTMVENAGKYCPR
jgi:hypothetical protein